MAARFSSLPGLGQGNESLLVPRFCRWSCCADCSMDGMQENTEFSSRF